MPEDKKKESLLEKVGNSPVWKSIFRSQTSQMGNHRPYETNHKWC